MIPRSRKRLVGLYAVALAMLVALSGRLWYLQVLDTGQYKALAQVNGTRTIVVPAVRGMITDDTGAALVTNQVSMTVAVNMMQLSQTTRDSGKAVLARLAPLLGMSDNTLTEKVRLCTRGVPQPCWTGSPYQPIPVAENVSDAIALQIMEEPTLFPGVTAQMSPIVDYPMPDGANPAQALGYLQPITQAEMAKDHLPETGYAGDDLVGQSGLEAQYNTALTGKAGTRVVSVNAAGDVLGTVGGAAPQTGDTLVTSLNAKVQAVAQQALNSAIAKARAAGNDANQGAAIVETTTGQIVAMASYPAYDPNVWSGTISQREVNYLFGLGKQSGSGQPALNWATQGQYAPGSTFKVTSTAAAVGDGFPLHGLYACPASVNISGATFINDGEPGMGDMTFAQALIKSCDTVYYNLGYDMYLRDNRAANNVLSPKAPTQKMQQMELDVGLRQVHGRRPARGVRRHDPDPPVALLDVGGQRAQGPELVQERAAKRLVRAADRVGELPGRLGLGTRPGGDRRDRPGLRDRHAAAAHQRLHGAGRRRHAVRAAARRGPGLPVRQGGAADQPAGDQAPAGRVGDPFLYPPRAGRRGDVGHRGRRVQRVPA